MASTITTTSIGILINGELTLADHVALYDILDEEPDFGARLKYAIQEKFKQITDDHIEMFNTGGGFRPDLVMAYIHQMQLCTQLLSNLYPAYRSAVAAAEKNES